MEAALYGKVRHALNGVALTRGRSPFKRGEQAFYRQRFFYKFCRDIVCRKTADSSHGLQASQHPTEGTGTLCKGMEGDHYSALRFAARLGVAAKANKTVDLDAPPGKDRGNCCRISGMIPGGQHHQPYPPFICHQATIV